MDETCDSKDSKFSEEHQHPTIDSRENVNHFGRGPLNDDFFLKDDDRVEKIWHIVGNRNIYFCGIVFCLFVAFSRIATEVVTSSQSQNQFSELQQRNGIGRRLQESDFSASGRSLDNSFPVIRLVVYGASSATYVGGEHEKSVARKQMHDVNQFAKKLISSTNDIQIESITYLLTKEEQLSFVKENCGDAVPRMLELYETKPHWAVSIVQWCALSISTRETSSNNAVLFLDPCSPLVLRTQQQSFTLTSYLRNYVIQNIGSKTLPNIAVSGSDFMRDTIHGSFLLLRRSSQNHDLAKRMLKLVLSTDALFVPLESNALLMAQTLHSLIRKRKEDWYFLEQKCRMDPPRRTAEKSKDVERKGFPQISLSCPTSGGYCCSIQDKHGASPATVLLTRHPILPYQVLDHANIMTPYNREKVNKQTVDVDELPYISTITETIIPKPVNYERPHTFYELLAAKHCLPADDNCSKCLREKRGASCKSCRSLCHCYCKALCNPDERPRSRHIAKKLIVMPPPYKRDPTRIIPRIVHQTWFEQLSPTKYPNMSRLVQSFVRSGWEYKFYTDAQAGDFLTEHFPKEIREAYDALRPGAFKADLFRYCVLLIHGGVYADVDIQLESALDLAIAPDIGFMVPIDEVRVSFYYWM